MNIEYLNPRGMDAIMKKYLMITEEALVNVLSVNRPEAKEAILSLLGRFKDASENEIFWLLHNDPVILACDITGKKWGELDSEKVSQFNQKYHSAASSFSL